MTAEAATPAATPAVASTAPSARPSAGRMLATICLASVFLLAGCATAPSAVGDWGSTASGQPHLTLTQSGEVNGSDGCNTLAGKWTATGSEVTFKNLISTRMYCEGVDDWLSGAATADVQRDKLVIKNQSGTVIGSLAKAGN